MTLRPTSGFGRRSSNSRIERHQRSNGIPTVVKIILGIIAIVLAMTVQVMCKRRIVKVVEKAQAAATEAELEKSPLLRAMKVHEREEYERIKDRLKNAPHDADAKRQVAADVFADITTPMIDKYVPTASNAAVLRFGRALLRQVTDLGTISPESAWTVLFPHANEAPDAVAIAVSAELEEEMQQSIADLITTGAVGRRTNVDPGTLQEIIASVVGELSDEDREAIALLDDPDNPEIDKKACIRALRAYYKSVLALPETEAVLVLRETLGN